MEDFESLLRGAAQKHENEILSEAAVSEMIDKRLVDSKSKLQASFKKEIRLIVISIGFLILYIVLGKYVYANTLKASTLKAYMIACYGGILYCLISIVLFKRLLQLSLLEKDKGIRSYITGLYKKTKQTVLVYFWTSVVVSTGMVSGMLFSYKYSTFYLEVLITVVVGIGLYYLNRWYMDKRFGKKLQELELLIAEFNEPDK